MTSALAWIARSPVSSVTSLIATCPFVTAGVHSRTRCGGQLYRVSGVRTLNETSWNLARRAQMGAEYALFRRGPLTMAPAQLGLFARSSPDVDRADLEFHVQPPFARPARRAAAPLSPITTSVCSRRPTSRGYVGITSPAPEARRVIAPNYLSMPEDRGVVARLARRTAAAPSFRRYDPVEYLPGPEVRDDDNALARAAGDIGTTIFHPVGTVRMGLAGDPLAVLDKHLRVRGVSGLRVADASAMPTITSGNTNAPTMMIAERGADMILKDARR